jgi:anti-anti-sigma regulatory factor
MEESLKIELEANNSIAKAEELLKEFRDVFILGQSITINASKVDKIDTACLQLIVSLKKSLVAAQHDLIIEDASANFKHAVDAVALTEFLELN